MYSYGEVGEGGGYKQRPFMDHPRTSGNCSFSTYSLTNQNAAFHSNQCQPPFLHGQLFFMHELTN